MSKKTKLEIIGEYRKDHPGPFCTRDGLSVRIISRTGGSSKYPIVALIEGCELAGSFEADGSVFSPTGQKPDDIMCAREVPVAREFWVATTPEGQRIAFGSEVDAAFYSKVGSHIIHVREVLPGEDE